MPHSVFLDWDRDDRDKAVMHQIRKSERCSGCGTHPDEWNPEMGGSVDAYVTKLVHCKGCQTKEAGEAEFEEAKKAGEKARRGTTVQLKRNPKAGG